ncbi:MAG: PAS domain-containing sensor histidine kinase, partial [Bacteroidota bacterium]
MKTTSQNSPINTFLKTYFAQKNVLQWISTISKIVKCPFIVYNPLDELVFKTDNTPNLNESKHQHQTNKKKNPKSYQHAFSSADYYYLPLKLFSKNIGYILFYPGKAIKVSNTYTPKSFEENFSHIGSLLISQAWLALSNDPYFLDLNPKIQACSGKEERYVIRFNDKGEILYTNASVNFLKKMHKGGAENNLFHSLSIKKEDIINSYQRQNNDDEEQNPISRKVRYQTEDSSISVQWTILPGISAEKGHVFTAFGQNLHDLQEYQEALLRNEEKFRSIIEQSIEGIILIDPDDRIIEWNEAMTDMLGITKKDSLGAKCHELNKLLDKHIIKVIENDQRTSIFHAQDTQTSHHYEIRCYNQEKNKYLDLRQIIFPIDIYGMRHTCIFFRDVTEQKQTQKELEENEELFRTITENMQDLLCLLDENYHFKYISPAHHDLLGYKQNQLLSSSLFDIIHPEDQKKIQDNFHEGLKKGFIPKQAFQVIKDNQGTIWLESKNSILLNEKGEARGIIASCRDITERKKIQETERKYLKNNQFLTQSAMELVDQVNEENIYTWIAEKMQALHPKAYIIVNKINSSTKTIITKAISGFSEIQEKIIQLTGWHPVGRTYYYDNTIYTLKSGHVEKFTGGLYKLTFQQLSWRISRMLEKLMNAGNIYSIGILLNNELVGNIVFIYPLGFRFENSKTTRLFTQEISITLRKLRAEKDKQKAQESNRLKSAFLANMSHEIRTPMNGIIGFCQLLKNDSLDNDEKNELIQAIDSNSKQLLNTINDIIDISKIEAGQISIQPMKTSLNDTIRELNTLFAQELDRLDKSHLKLIPYIGLPDQEAEIVCDGYRLKQLFINLFTNAAKFTDEGAITFGYERVSPDVIRYFIRDTGIGISPEDQSIIFDRFKQAQEGSNRKYGGTGLGLSITKEIVELMGGAIQMRSKPGEGSIFYFELPYHPLHYDYRWDGKTSISHQYDWSGFTIGILEPDEKYFQYIQTILKPTRININRFTEQYPDLQSTQQTNPDICLVDILSNIENRYDHVSYFTDKFSCPVITQGAIATGP